MAGPSQSGRILPLLTALVVLVVVADVVRRALAGPPPVAPAAVVAPATSAQRAARAETVMVASLPGGVGTADEARREATILRLRQSGPATYLPQMLSEVDSSIRRWPDGRIRTPLKVAIVRGNVAGFREEFAGAVPWAVTRWNGALLPVQLDYRGSDTTGADIRVMWVAQLDSGRTGRAEVTWDQRQEIHRVTVQLATHAPGGRPLAESEMTTLALHELGHALGLGHSPHPDDVLFATARITELSARDRATARLLYELAPGSLR